MKSKSLPAATILDHTVMCANIYRSFALACVDPLVYREGFNFWPDCQRDCINAVNDLAQGNVITDLVKFSGLVAAISPSRYWRKNVIDAIHSAFAWGYFGDDDSRIAHILDCRVGIPYGVRCFVRGWEILDGKRVLSFKGAPKTYSMQDNTIYPLSSQEVTVDQHIVHLLLGDGLTGSVKISKRQYLAFSRSIRECALQLGLLPCTLQAIIWVQRQYELRAR